MSALTAWFAGRTLRERRLLLVMLALAAVTIVWALVIVPVRNGLSASRARYAAAVIDLGEAEARLRAVKAIQRRQLAPVPLPLADTVRARADTAGVPLAALDPDGTGSVRVSIGGAPAGAVLGWIAGLEAEGVLVDQIALSPAGPGLVSATATLRGRGS